VRLRAGIPEALRLRPGPIAHPARLLPLGLLALVLAGTLLLELPVSRSGPGSAPLRTALLSATSAVTATGLSTVDTGTYWSGFGQVVLLVLMQVGGLGMMVAASLLGLVVLGRLGLRSRLLSRSATGTVDLGTVRRIVVGTIVLALAIEAVVVVAVALRLWLHYGESFGRALWLGTFHAVSAFTNAGFTLWPDSLARFAPDPWILAPTAAAFVLGGLGYPVLLETLRVRPARLWSVHTRLTLVVSAVLLVVGPLVVTLGEWRNPATLGALDVPGRLLAGAFGGISPRSAGFATFDYGHADASTMLFTSVLMVIGGASGSTAGGIKVTTVALIVLAVVAEVRGHPDVDAFGRRIAPATVRQAIAVSGMAFALVVAASLTLLELTGENLDAVLFEVSSAFGSSGLSVGLTPRLPAAGQYLLVAVMLAGRLGPITLATALALRHTRRAFRNPEARPIVG
jgi:trk system potassium uptake protein